MPPCSSIPVDDLDRADACDGGDRSSASRLPDSALPSRQPPSAADRDHLGATFHASCDDGADRSSPSACCRRHFRATTGSWNVLPF